MSIKIMSQVWDADGIDSSECLVLIALADHADDQGHCYPSIGRLARRTKLSDRGVQKVISRLIEKGFIRVIPCAGQGGANRYIVTATPTVPAVAVGVNHVHPEPRSPRTTFTTPPNHVRQTPEPRSPKPSRTIIEPSDVVGARETTFDEFWSSWPLGKVGKDAAKRAWAKLAPDRRRMATDCAADWCRTWAAANPRLNPIHPASYLNGKRWEDETPPPFALIPGGKHDHLARQDRQAAASDALRHQLDVAGRMRRPSSPNCF